MRSAFVAGLLMLLGLVSGQEAPELIFLIELCRHGARTPFINPMNTSWIKEAGEGSLTPVGMRQHFVLGQQIRERYKDFLPATYNASWLYTYSTHINRTIQSAYSQMDGLFFEGGTELPPGYNGETNYTWPPITVTVPLKDYSDASLPKHYYPIIVHSNEANRDLIMGTSATCEYLGDKIRDNLDKATEFENALSHLKDDIIKMADALEYYNPDNVWTIDIGASLADYMKCALWNDEEISIKYPDSLYQTADYLLALDMYIEFEDHANTATFATGMVKEFLYYLEGKVENPDWEMKMALFSGHDTNIANMMALFNLTNFNCTYDYMMNNKPFDQDCIGNPPFASSAFFELYQDSEDFLVKFRVNDDYYNLCGDHENGEGYCPWEDIRDLLKSSINENFDDTCHDYIYQYKWEGIKSYFYLVLGFSVAAIVTFLSIVVTISVTCCLHQKARRESDEA